MSEKKKENLVIFLILAVLSIVLIVYSYTRIEVVGALGFGADLLPRTIGWLVAACALGFLGQAIMMKETKDKDQPQAPRKKIDPVTLIRFGAALGILLVYIALLRSIGFIILSTIYIFVQSNLMVPAEKRSYLLSAVISVAASFAIYFLFARGLNIRLPGGLLTGLF